MSPSLPAAASAPAEPLKGKYLDELNPGDRVEDSVFVVKSPVAGNGANGPYVSLTLCDAGGERPARRFQVTDAERDLLLSAPFVRVSGRVEAKPQYAGQVILETVEAVNPVPSDLSPYLPPLPVEHRSHWERFCRLVRSLTDPDLRRLLKAVFDQPTCESLRRAVAAQKMHHAYPGGLLEHTVEVAELCDNSCTVFPFLRRDLLITGALLHDIGKLAEMEHGVAAGTYTAEGTLLGHIVLGALRIERAALSLTGFPDEKKTAVLHLIASHHELPEYGAAAVPAIGEAFILSQCDRISARINEWSAAVQSAASSGQQTAPRRGRDGGYLFTGDLGFSDFDGRDRRVPADPLTNPPLLPDTALSLDYSSGNSFAVASGARLPVLGLVAAGDGDRSLAELGEEREVILPPGGADFLLRVTGDSMTGAGIHDGDLLMVRRSSADGGSADAPRENDIVIAHVPGNAGGVVKRFGHDTKTGRALLISENPAYSPIEITEDTRFQGLVVGLLRDYR